jgi:hypothetical protein
MRQLIISIFTFTSVLTIMYSCNKGGMPDTANPETGTIKITFKNTVNGNPLLIDSRFYTNSFGENYVVINNIDRAANEKESYHLIDEASEASHSFTYTAMPDTYTTLNFTIGVDSIRNSSGAQTGALDPLNGMFWTWNSGYIMAKLEATSPSSNQVNSKVEYHIGGYSGINSVLKRITLVLPATKFLVVQKDKTSEIIVTTNLDKWWQSPNDLKITDNPVCTTPGVQAKKIADNYSSMFAIKDVINN